MRDKFVSAFKICLGAVIGFMPLASTHSISVNYFTWTGPGGDFSNVNNWTPTGYPSQLNPNDVGQFNGSGPSAVNFNLGATVGALVFSGSTAYTFSQSSNTVSFIDTGILGVGGVGNNSGATQTFNINANGIMEFRNNTSANYGSSPVSYNLGSNASLTFFDNSTASDATIGTTGPFSFINFTNNSNAGSASITLNGGSELIFGNTSDPDQAKIEVNDTSFVIFATVTPASSNGPTLVLNGSSQANIGISNQVCSLSGETGTNVNLYGSGFTPTTLQTNEGNNVSDVFYGTILGVTGSQLIKDGAGSLQLTHAMPVSGGPTAYIWNAIINNGTLIGDTTNLDRNLQINHGCTVVFDQGSTLSLIDLDIDHQLTNTGASGGLLLKKGLGNLNIISNNDTFAGQVEVAQGSLGVNIPSSGGLGNGNFILTADTDGLLYGTGKVNGSVIVNGTISPGNSIDTFSINGSYTQNSGSDYIVELDDTGASDLISVSGTPGTATLNGGTVVAESIDGTFLIDVPYTILTASGGVNGVYDNAIQNNINLYLSPRLSYDTNDVYLTLDTNFAGFANNANQLAVAEQLDCIQNPAHSLQFVLQNLVTLNPQQLNHTLDEMSGQQYTSLFEVSQQSGRQFLRDLYGPLLFGRDLVNDSCDDECSDSCVCDFEMWKTVHFGQTYLKGDHDSKGYKVRSIDAAIGIQSDINDCWKTGLAFFYQNSHIDFRLNGKANGNIFRTAIYGLYQNECYYGLVDAMFGYSHYNIKRHIEFADVDLNSHATPRIFDGTLYLEAGTDCKYSDCLTIQPFFGIEAGYYWQNHFYEKGAHPLNLEVKGKNLWNCDTRLGLRMTSHLACDIVLSADAAWQHWYTKHDNKVHVRFREFCNQFTVEGPRFKRDLIDGSIYLGKTFCDGWTVFLRGFGERSENYSNYSAAIGLDVIL